MRKNQVTINILRVGDQVPNPDNNTWQSIDVYCDADDLYEALSGAVFEALGQLRTDGEDLGVRRQHYVRKGNPDTFKLKALSQKTFGTFDVTEKPIK